MQCKVARLLEIQNPSVRRRSPVIDLSRMNTRYLCHLCSEHPLTVALPKPRTHYGSIRTDAVGHGDGRNLPLAIAPGVAPNTLVFLALTVLVSLRGEQGFHGYVQSPAMGIDSSVLQEMGR